MLDITKSLNNYSNPIESPDYNRRALIVGQVNSFDSFKPFINASRCFQSETSTRTDHKLWQLRFQIAVVPVCGPPDPPPTMTIETGGSDSSCFEHVVVPHTQAAVVPHRPPGAAIVIPGASRSRQCRARTDYRAWCGKTGNTITIKSGWLLTQKTGTREEL